MEISKYRRVSLFTAKIYFKDRRAISFHSWKQETVNGKVNHRFAWNSLHNLIKGYEGKYITALIYFNHFGDFLASKYVNGKLEMQQQVFFSHLDTGDILFHAVTGLENGKPAKLQMKKEDLADHITRNKQFKTNFA